MGEFQTKRKLELENIFVKKYKVTNEISTFSFNEKENEEYYQHHYHPYTENGIIDFVNDDCLAEIFMYVPICERFKLSLVCQKWKRALEYSWGNAKKLELTYWKYNKKKPTCLKNYQTLDGQLSFLKSLLFKCGHYLTLLDLTDYSHCNIVPVVNKFCPNLVELRLKFNFFDDEMLYDAFSRLSKLKVLKIIFQKFMDEFIPLTLINSLRNVADTLTDLILCNWADEVFRFCNFPEVFICVIRELKALKRFEVFGIRLSKEFRYYMVNNLPMYACHGSYLPRLGGNQLQRIQQLNLGPDFITDDGVYTIANNLKNLVDLRMHWDELTNAGIVTISKMKLKILTFDGFNDNVDSSSLKLLKKMIILRLTHNNNITDDLAIKLLKKSPRIEQLYVLNSSVTIKLIKKAEKISRKRNQHLILGVLLKGDMKKYESPYLEIDIPRKLNDWKILMTDY